MKSFFVFLYASILASIGYAQKTWNCPEFDADLQKYNQISKQFKSKGNKLWSEKLLEVFPIASDNTIKSQYIIKTDSIFNIEDINNVLLSWYKVKMTNLNPNPTGSPDRLSGIAVLQNVGRYVGYMNATYINAQEEVTIDIKENKVRVTVAILGYMSANSWQGAEVVYPGSCYPCIRSGKQKDSHAMAFINSHSEMLNTVYSIMNHLNENSRVIKDGQDEW